LSWTSSSATNPSFELGLLSNSSDDLAYSNDDGSGGSGGRNNDDNSYEDDLDDNDGRSTTPRAGGGPGEGRVGTTRRLPLSLSSSKEKKKMTRMRGCNFHKVDRMADMRFLWRYHGFSTSLSSLFLDELIVCGSILRWGLILLSRVRVSDKERHHEIAWVKCELRCRIKRR
jgi:hypothetical protein